ncbi:MAG TPA: hypothetical protein VHR45_08270 [Thermoanaerobaculia bacterium]|nr:hypothetical protein [Thermoanaerobaculia bacterium]
MIVAWTMALLLLTTLFSTYLPSALWQAVTKDGIGAHSPFYLAWPSIAFLALVVFCLGVALGRFTRDRSAKAMRSALTFLGAHGTQLIAFALLLPLLVIFFKEAVAQKRDAKNLAELAAVVLVLAVLASSGQILLSRLKKLGPLELFEKHASGLAGHLKELAKEVLEAQKNPFSPSSEDTYRRSELLIWMVEFNLSAEEIKDASKQGLPDLLYWTGLFAVLRRNWPAATTRLERLRWLLGEADDRDEITNNLPYKLALNLGKAFLGRVQDAREHPERALDPREAEESLYKSLAHFARAVNKDPYSYIALYNRAFVEDELRMFERAIASNRAALELRPDHARAKYNIAVSLIKMEGLKAATRSLVRIKRSDLDGEEMLKLSKTDQDLEPLFHDAYCARRIRWWWIRQSQP